MVCVALAQHSCPFYEFMVLLPPFYISGCSCFALFYRGFFPFSTYMSFCCFLLFMQVEISPTRTICFYFYFSFVFITTCTSRVSLSPVLTRPVDADRSARDYRARRALYVCMPACVCLCMHGAGDWKAPVQCKSMLSYNPGIL